MIESAQPRPSTVTELADRMQLTQSTVTELVTRAESAGPRHPEPVGDDARFWLELTDEGIAAPRALPQRAEPRLIELLNARGLPCV